VDITKMQREVREYDKKHGWDKDSAEHVVLHMLEELGEISREVMREGGYKKEEIDKERLAEELTDLLYLTFKLANQFDIKLDKEWDAMRERYKTKTSRL